MVGRQTELGTAMSRWDDTVAGRGQIVIIQGEAGIGKSRLAHEIFRKTRRSRAKFVLFQCLPHGRHSTLLPLVHRVQAVSPGQDDFGELTFERVAAVMQREGVSDSLAIEICAFMVGAGGPSRETLQGASPQRVREQIGWAARQCIEEWTKAGPIVIAVEDFHWADPTSAELLDDLVGWINTKPVLLVLTTREPAPLASAVGNVTAMVLRQLKTSEANALITGLWRGQKIAKLPRAALSLVYKRSNGVPLYVEEVCRLLTEAIAAGRADWQEILSNARLSSLETVLSTRLSAMGPARKVAQTASVLGQSFNEQLLRAVLPDLSEERILAALDELVDAGILVHGRRGSSVSYAFRHALI